MKKKLLTIMSMCLLAGSLGLAAQDNMKPDSKDQAQSGDSMKHDNMSNDSMKNDNMKNDNTKNDQQDQMKH